MREITNLPNLKATINDESLLLVYLSMPHCSVCHAVKPRIQSLLQDRLPLYHLDIAVTPEAAGYFQVWTAPVVLLFYQGKEILRQARFIDFQLLEKTVAQYQNVPEPTSYQALFDQLPLALTEIPNEKKQSDEFGCHRP